MAGLIPQTFIDDLLDRVDIVDVVNSRVPLKKTGKSHKACCPFHEEKSPSFTVAQDKQFYYCFGCGAGGNALSFIMEFDRIDFLPAVELLAKNVGMEIPREAVANPKAKQHRDDLYSVVTEADNFYRQKLRAAEAKPAVEYLKGRGLTGKIAAQFGIGYAPQGWDNLLKVAGTSEEKVKLLADSGMLVVKPEEKKQYDRFRHRIMFPIRDQRGRTLGFGGRVLDDSTPKYLNSPETPIFHKGRELYGLYEARQALKEIPYLLMVEGYMDVIALAQFGIHNAVATLGTALTENHLQKLFRYTSEIVFCFDGDSAGRRAASRSLDIALPEMRDGVTAKFLFLPEGEDPDTMVRNLGAEKFQTQIQNATPLSEFLFEEMAEGIDIETGEGKAKLSKLIAPKINQIPAGVFKQLMLEELSRKTSIAVDDLKTYVGSHATKASQPIEPSPTYNEESSSQNWEPAPVPAEDDYGVSELSPIEKTSKIRLTPIKHLTALLINHPQLAEHVDSTKLLDSSSDTDTQLFLKLLNVVQSNPQYKPSHIFAYWHGTYSGSQETQILQDLAASELYHPPSGTGRDDNQEFCDALSHVLKEAFYQLPANEKATHLLGEEKLNESQIKQLHRLRLELPADEKSAVLKEQIKQRLLAQR
ncbi:MAG: DNA primase [Porticoccaceae bacterium]